MLQLSLDLVMVENYGHDLRSHAKDDHSVLRSGMSFEAVTNCPWHAAHSYHTDEDWPYPELMVSGAWIGVVTAGATNVLDFHEDFAGVESTKTTHFLDVQCDKSGCKTLDWTLLARFSKQLKPLLPAIGAPFGTQHPSVNVSADHIARAWAEPTSGCVFVAVVNLERERVTNETTKAHEHNQTTFALRIDPAPAAGFASRLSGGPSAKLRIVGGALNDTIVLGATSTYAIGHDARCRIKSDERACAGPACEIPPTNLSISISATEKGLAYSAAVDGEHWLSAPPVSANSSSLSVCVGGKVLRSFVASAAPSYRKGTDGFGTFDAEVHELQAAGLSVRLTKRSYPDHPEMSVLSLSFPERTSLCPDAELSTSFPSWSATAGAASNLTSLTWTSEHAVSRASWGRGLSAVLNSGTGGGPVVLYDEATKRVLMFSSLDHHKVIAQASSQTRHAQGLSASITGVPAGFEYSTVFFTGVGVTSTVYAWGHAMQRYHGHKVSWGTDSWRDDTVVLTRLGIFTDNGAYYGDWPPTQTSNRPWAAEEGLLVAKQTLAAAGVPIAYMQLDDWWYYGRFQLGSVRCVQRWEGDRDTINAATRKPALFPGGLPAFQRALGIGLMLYTPFWCENYDNPGKFNMTTAPKHAPLAGTKIVTPEDSRRFFDAIMEQGMQLTNGHLTAYEIDFL